MRMPRLFRSRKTLSKIDDIKSDDKKRRRSGHFAITGMILIILAAACAYGGVFMLVYLTNNLLLLFVIGGALVLLGGAAFLFIWALVCLITQFVINRSAWSWIALIVYIGAITLAVLLLLQF